MEQHQIFWNGDEWQSVFPSEQSEKSQLHSSVQDAFEYMTMECGVIDDILIVHSKGE